MIVADASVWASIFLENDRHHAVSRGWLVRVRDAKETIAAPTLLLGEVASVVSRRTGITRLGHNAAIGITTSPLVRLLAVDHRLGNSTARIAAELRLRSADAAYVALAYALEAPLVSWDAEQLERGGRLIAARTP